MPGPGFCFTTRLETVDDFIGRFHAACDKGSLFLKTATKLPTGERCEFKILLANKSPVLAGSAVVLEVFEGTTNRFGQPGVRLGIEQLSPESEDVFARLLAMRESKRTAALPQKELKAPARHATIAGMPALRQPLPPKKFSVPDIVPVAKTVTVPDIMPRTKPPGPPPGRGDVTLSRVKPQSASPVEVRAEGSNETRAATPIPEPVPAVEAAPVHVSRALAAPVAIAAPPIVEPPVVVAPPVVEEPPVVVAPPPVAPEPSILLAPEPPAVVAPEPPAVVAPEPPAVVAPEPARVETRTPGSSYVLPANPLMNISDESLGGFVECTLHEVAAEELVPPDGMYAQPEPGAVPEPISNELTTDATTPVIVPPTRLYELPRRRRRIAMTAGAAVAVIGIAIALWMTRGTNDHVAITVPDLSSIAQPQAAQAQPAPQVSTVAPAPPAEREIRKSVTRSVAPAHPVNHAVVPHARPASVTTKQPAPKAPVIERVPI